MDSITDVVVIGGGPAGLSAALSIYRFNHSVKIFDFDNNAPHYENPTRLTPGFEGKTLNEIRATCWAELQPSGLISYENTLIRDVQRSEDGLFQLVDNENQKWLGKTLLIATGARDVMLEIDGYKECFAKTILPCVFTFGYERRSGVIPSAGLLAQGMLALPPIASILVADTLKFAPSVTVYTNGSQPELDCVLNSQFGSDAVKIDDRKITSLRSNNSADVNAGITLSFTEGDCCVERFIVHKPTVEVDLPFASSLGLKMAPSGEIEVSPPSYRTSVEKVYAAGDCAGQARIHTSFSIAFSPPNDPAPLKYEQAGQLFSTVASSTCCVNGVLTDGNSTGEFRDLNGISTYLVSPPRSEDNSRDTAILYLTDIYGVQQVNNRLLADSFARAGYYVVQPDLFGGDPVPPNTQSNSSSNFNMTAWRGRHTTAIVDLIVNTTIASIRGELGFTKVAAVGYCFGGKHVVRFLASGKGLDAGFTAHPGGVVAAEWQGIASPLSIAFGEFDGSNTPAQRAAAEAIFQAKNAIYQTTLYSGAEHGFAIRTNLSDPRKKFAQEGAYFQALRWFDAWV
ncbi:hypothetical protein G7Y89_g1955 [Cudoniella acicularis]|uniref:Dienelactone hydrolase domain-containing protein n=1 Tax=Cudoniella acicularis TaxID=354080 RepID=A0A8H4W9T2_9HELO|nr:hypothetical protein G7Y89_g1955 [Cudoniella acicularis]